MLICGTSIPDFYIPANASTIAKKLDLTCVSLDVNSACSSFITDLAAAKGFFSFEEYNSIAIFNPERYMMNLDYSDRKSCVLFGDGSACAILVKTNDTHVQGLELLDIVLHSDPSGADQVIIPADGHFYQNGHAVQKFAISKSYAVTKEILDRNQLSCEKLSYFIGHQANLRMLQSLATKLGLTPEQHLTNVEQFGNQGAAGAPCVLSANWNLFKSGDLILVAVVGSGLTWGAALFRKL
jgi:3-oxoacyl-[acyl-carrier-protein] synthase-3